MPASWAGASLTLALLVDLGEAALCDSAAFVIEALSAGHARRGRAGAVGGRRAPRASSGRATRWTSRVAQAIGVVALPPVHAGGGTAGMHYGSRVSWSVQHDSEVHWALGCGCGRRASGFGAI
jgi:hypothetical protein